MFVNARDYGVDVSSFQGNSVAYTGAKFAIVKLTEGTGYTNPKAQAQITSAKNNEMLPMGYFFATFGSNQAQANLEAKQALSVAKSVGVPKGSYIAVDWETGDGNNVNGGKSASANAIMEAMATIKADGYQPLIYSGASLLRNNIDTSAIVKKFGVCVWVASYPTAGATYSANFAYFPSMEGVAIWQFTDNYKGLGVDGNITLIKLETRNNVAKTGAGVKTPLHTYVKYTVPRVFVVTNLDGCNVYADKTLQTKKDHWGYHTGHQVYNEEKGALDVGKDKWVDGRAGYTKSNPIAFYENVGGRLIIMQDHTHALYEPKADSAKAYAIKTGTILRFVGRKGRFFELKDKYKGKTVYVTAGYDGKRSYVVL